jgi:hypothetical protein
MWFIRPKKGVEIRRAIHFEGEMSFEKVSKSKYDELDNYSASTLGIVCPKKNTTFISFIMWLQMSL